MLFFYIKISYEYKDIFLYFFLNLILVLIFLMLSYFLSLKRLDNEKLSVYECGFEPFDDSRGSFNIQFYVIGVLFLIFDLEIVFLYPWSKVVGLLGSFGFWVMIVFLLILTLGFCYEWQSGALNWKKNDK